MEKTKFSKLSIKKQRITVLKDALKLIKAKLLKIDPCTVLQLDKNNYSYRQDIDQDQQLQNVLIARFKRKQPCVVCERGALLVATVLNDNNFTVMQIEFGGTFHPASNTDKRLMKIFAAKQLWLMENVLMLNDDGILDEKDGFLFALAFLDSTDRAIAILENAIAHNGIFTP